jgi:hypothetical protein
MLPVSAGLVSFGHILGLGAHRDTNESFALSGRLVDAEEIASDFRQNNLKMFSKEDNVYWITLAKDYQVVPDIKGEAKYGFYAALPESPGKFIGQKVILEYNRVRNVFGGIVDVEGTFFNAPLPVRVGTPIYGKITLNKCVN